MSSLQPEFFSNLLVVSLRRSGSTIVLANGVMSSDSGKEPIGRYGDGQLAVGGNVRIDPPQLTDQRAFSLFVLGLRVRLRDRADMYTA